MEIEVSRFICHKFKLLVIRLQIFMHLCTIYGNFITFLLSKAETPKDIIFEGYTINFYLFIFSLNLHKNSINVQCKIINNNIDNKIMQNYYR